MDISTLLKDPDALYADMHAFLSSKDRIAEGLAHLSFANGLMTAAAISPEFIRPAEWMPLATGPLEQLESSADMQLALSLTALQYNEILDGLRSGDKSYEPFFWQDGDERIVTHDWAAGFLSGARLRRAAWDAIPEPDHGLVLAMVTILQQDAEVRAKAAEAGLDPDRLWDEARDMAPGLVQRLYNCFGNRPVPELTALARVTQKPGRNDPCPCGSGKKYKKCCLH
jgi:uncharacterized protein